MELKELVGDLVGVGMFFCLEMIEKIETTSHRQWGLGEKWKFFSMGIFGWGCP